MTAETSEATAAARARYAEQVTLAALTSRAVLDAWSDVDAADPVRSWLDQLVGRVLRVVAGAQASAARGAYSYVERVRQARRRSTPTFGRVNSRQLAGVAADGRPLESLLAQPAVTVARAVRDGVDRRRAMTVGAVQLDMIVRTEVADAGRVATSIEIAATPTLGYVRMLTPPSCARCAILAGRFYRWNAGFQRHPRCDCIHIPCSEDQAGDLRTDPRGYFDSLGEVEQRRIFTAAGARAIRDGADVARTVNARRGMYTADGRRYTSEGTRRRGARRIRLMPEAIYAEARGDRQEAMRLLRLHGYLI